MSNKKIAQTIREIASISNRPVTLRLSDEDCERLARKAGEVGLTVEDLLQDFIGDLVNGTYSNGSDGQMQAQQWFDRVGFEDQADKTFLRWLLKHGDIDDFLLRYSMIEELWQDLVATNPMESGDYNRREMRYQQSQLNKAYAKYCVDCGNDTPEPYEAAVLSILNWNARLRAFRGY